MKKSLNSVVQLQKLRKKNEISKDQFHNEVVDIFTKNLSFNFVEVIGRGSVSTVLKVRNKDAERGYAIKILLKEDVGPKELEWGRIRNKYLLPLLDTEYFPVFDLTWFISPVVKLTLEDAIKKDFFKNNSKAYNVAVSWIQQITSAIGYLHKNELSFYNLKLRNVMVMEDKCRVKLFGFHRLNTTGEFTTMYDVPDVFMPPESYSTVGRKLQVEGKAFDLWCLGVLSMEVFTGNSLERNISKELCCWCDITYPLMFKTLKAKHFNKSFQSAFPQCHLKNKALKVVRNFSRACLRLSPASRPSTEFLLTHMIFYDNGMLAEKDKIWKKYKKPISMKKKIINMNILFENVECIRISEDIEVETQPIDIDDNVYNDSDVSNLRTGDFENCNGKCLVEYIETNDTLDGDSDVSDLKTDDFESDEEISPWEHILTDGVLDNDSDVSHLKNDNFENDKEKSPPQNIDIDDILVIDSDASNFKTDFENDKENNPCEQIEAGDILDKVSDGK